MSGRGGGSDQVVPSGQSQTDLELFLGLGRKPAGIKVLAGGSAEILVEQILAKYGGGPLIDVGQVNLALVLGASLTLSYRNSQLLSQASNGLGKTDPILAHEELEDTSASSATKTFEDALDGADTK